MKVVMLEPGQTAQIVEIGNGLEPMQSAVDGYIDLTEKLHTLTRAAKQSSLQVLRLQMQQSRVLFGLRATRMLQLSAAQAL